MEGDNPKTDERPRSASGLNRRSSIVASRTISSPLHTDDHNIFIKFCETHTLATFLWLFSFVAVVAIIGFAITFSYRDDVQIGKKSSGLILSSGEGLIAKINTYIIDMPKAECKGVISTFPDGRYSFNFLDTVSEDTSDDYYSPNDCEFIDHLVVPSADNVTYSLNLVGECNSAPISVGYIENVAIIFEGKDLFSAESLKGMCQLDASIRNFQHYSPSKCRYGGVDDTCCPSRSLGNYVAALNGLQTCDDITDNDGSSTVDLLRTCLPSYNAGTLTGDCWDWTSDKVKSTQCPKATEECARYNAVYDMLNALLPSSALEDEFTDSVQLTRMMIPYNATSKDWLVDLYYDKMRFKTHESFGGAEVVGYDLRVKSIVFGNFLSWDALLLIPITFVAVLSVLAVEQSLFVAIFAVLSIYLTFGVTLFVFSVVLWISYIPFFILFTGSILLYVGLGFFFLYAVNWKESHQTLGENVHDADRLAFVWHHTSLKTFASAISSSCCLFTAVLFPIPSMKCFGLFCGIAILILFLVSNLFFPVLIMLNHKSDEESTLYMGKLPWIGKYLKADWSKVVGTYDYAFNWKYTILLFLLGGGLCISVFSFDMDMESVASAQLLFTEHPFERYDRVYEHKFKNSPMNKDSNLDMTVAYGIHDGNTIKPFNPYQRDDVNYYAINISSEYSQELLYSLCYDMYYEKGNQNKSLSIQNINCFSLFFPQWMHAPCADTVDDIYPDTSTWLTPQRSSCCDYPVENITFPPHVFTECIYDWAVEYGQFKTGVWWDTASREIKVVTVTMESQEKFDTSYPSAIDFWDSLDNWSRGKIRGTPLHHSFSTSNMELLRYQRGLIVGLQLVTPLSLSIAALVVLVMCRNIIAAFSFFVAVFLALSAFIGSLQVLGEDYSLFSAVATAVAIAMSTQSASLLSHSFCEAGTGYDSNRVIGKGLVSELGPSRVITFSVVLLAALFLLGGNNYYTFAFGAGFVLILFYGILFPHLWNLMFLSAVWIKHPFGEWMKTVGLTPLPCCYVDTQTQTLTPEETSAESPKYMTENPLYQR